MPSAQTSNAVMVARSVGVGQNDGSSAQRVIGSPVEAEHESQDRVRHRVMSGVARRFEPRRVTARQDAENHASTKPEFG